MSDAEFADYKAHPDAYFGRIVSPAKKIESPYELFEWLMEANKGLSRQTILESLATAPDFAALQGLSKADLLAEYCERLVAITPGINK